MTTGPETTPDALLSVFRDLFIKRDPHHYPIVQQIAAVAIYAVVLAVGWVVYGWPVLLFRGWARAFTWRPDYGR